MSINIFFFFSCQVIMLTYCLLAQPLNPTLVCWFLGYFMEGRSDSVAKFYLFLFIWNTENVRNSEGSRETEIHRNLSSAGLLPKFLQQLGLAQVKARNPELQLGSNYLNHHSCLHRAITDASASAMPQLCHSSCPANKVLLEHNKS